MVYMVYDLPEPVGPTMITTPLWLRSLHVFFQISPKGRWPPYQQGRELSSRRMTIFSP
jgi:hypothetical protein